MKITSRNTVKLIGTMWTMFGFIIFIRGYYIDGLLAMILGELVDMPKNK